MCIRDSLEAELGAVLLLVLQAQGDVAAGDDVVQGFQGVAGNLLAIVVLGMAFADAPELAATVVVVHQGHLRCV